MTEPTTEKIVDRIAKLLNSAERAATTGEAEMFSTRAAELIMKHRVDEESIRRRQSGQGRPTESITRHVMSFTGIYGKINMVFANSVVQALGDMRTIDATTVERRGGYVLWVIGYQSDVQHAALLVASLHTQCAHALEAWWRTYDSRDLTEMQKFTNRRTFIDAFARGAVERINRARGNVEESAEPGMALALRTRVSAIDDFLAQLGVKTEKRAIVMLIGSQESRDAGDRAGRNSNTHDPGVDVSRRQLNAT